MTRIEPVEIVARREALGLTQAQLAAWLPWKQSRISEVESGKRSWPDWATDRLAIAEKWLDTLADRLYTAGKNSPDRPVVIPTYTVESHMWLINPELRGLPVSVHRVAAVEAMKMLADDNIEARIGDFSVLSDMAARYMTSSDTTQIQEENS